MKLPQLSKSEVAQSIEASREAAAFTDKLPTWSDLKGAFKAEPEPGPDGSLTLDVPMDTRTDEGRRRAAAYIELMTPAWARQGDHAQRRRARQVRKMMRDRQGRERNVLPEHEDMVGRRYGTSRTSMTVPELPWPRTALPPGRHRFALNEHGEPVER